MIRFRMSEYIRSKTQVEALGLLSSKEQKQELSRLMKKEEEDDTTPAELYAIEKLKKDIAQRALILSIAPGLQVTEKEQKKLSRRKKQEQEQLKQEPRPMLKKVKKSF